MGCWEVVVNWLASIEPLLLSGYFGRTIDTVGALFTEVQVASCKTMYLDANKHEMFSLAKSVPLTDVKYNG